MASRTFKDFMVECVTYEYSQEYFDLKKEISELKLMERYLENQQFLHENADLINSANIHFDSGYFAEAVETETANQVKDKAAKKSVSIGTKIQIGWNSIIRTLKRFVERFMASHSKYSKDQKALYKAIMSRKFQVTDSIAKDIVAKVNAAAKKSGAFKPMANQLYLKNLRSKSNDKDWQDACVWLSVVLSSDKVFASPKVQSVQQFDGVEIAALPIQSIATLADYMGKPGQGNLDAAVAYVNSEVQKFKKNKNGLVLDVSDGAIKKDKEYLEKLSEQLKGLANENFNNAQANSNDESKKAPYLEKYNKIAGVLRGCVGLTLQVYTGYINVYTDLIQQLRTYLHTGTENNPAPTETPSNNQEEEDHSDDPETDFSGDMDG